jgi:UDP-4-amino-4-deoxy-L-arabinose-oxoglutarate aminotransferase
VPHLSYYRKKYGYQRGQFPDSERWGDGTISLPLFPSIDAQSQEYVIATFEREWRSLEEGGIESGRARDEASR